MFIIITDLESKEDIALNRNAITLFCESSTKTCVVIHVPGRIIRTKSYTFPQLVKELNTNSHDQK